MATQARAGTTALLGPLVASVPLAVQVICHEDNIVDHLRDFGNREGLEVPVGSRGGDRHGLPGQQVLEHD